MNHQDNGNNHSDAGQPSFWRSRSGITLGVLGAIAGFLLISEHQAHLFEALPFLLIGGCIVMHLFMHAGHGGHGGHSSHRQEPDQQPVDGDRGDETTPARLISGASTEQSKGPDS